MKKYYSCGEEITKDRIQDEPWYYEYYQPVAEVLSAGFDENNPYFERMPDGLNMALKAVRKYFKKYPGSKGSVPPSNDRLRKWIQSMWLSEESMQKIDKIKAMEKAI